MTSQNKKRKLFFILLFSQIFIWLFLFIAANVMAADSKIGDIQLQVPIFENTSVPDLPHYILIIYKYIIYVIIPLGIIMIIWAGIRWIIAGGDMGKIKEAKKHIASAFIGIMIAVLSYVILELVGVTELKQINPEFIKGEQNLEVETEDNTIPIVGSSSAGIINGGSYPSVGGSCFPVAKSSFSKPSWNWGSPRSGGDRCHAGIDLYTRAPGEVLAIAAGQIKKISRTFKTCCSGWGCIGCNCDKNKGPIIKKQTGGVLIYHPSLNTTVFYGEIDVDKLTVNGGSVKSGQILGRATYCGMNHVEFYQGNASSTSQWYPPKGTILIGSNVCAKNYLSTRTGGLVDPGPTLKNLQSKMCGN